MSDKNFVVGKPVNVTQYFCPGIYRIDSVETKRSFFGHGQNLFLDLRDWVDALETGECENERLQDDYRDYGFENFYFFILETGPDVVNPKVREKKVKIYKKTWPHELY